MLYEEYPDDGFGMIFPFLGVYIELNPFAIKLYTRETQMVMIMYDTTTKKGVVLPDLLQSGYYGFGVIAGKFDVMVLQYYKEA